MNTLPLKLNSRRGIFSRTFYKVLENNLPRRFKRLIYVSSILRLIQQVQDPDMQLITKLNNIFKIAHSPDAFAFPMYIKSAIWKDAIDEAVYITSDKEVAIEDLISQDLSNKDCTVIGEYFANHAPTWLLYGAVDTMVNDIVMLVKQLKQYNTEPTALPV